MQSRVMYGIKEIYQQIGEYEYNQLNPYAEMRKEILARHPSARIKRTVTEMIVVGAIQAPMLKMFYEVTTPHN